VNTAYWLGIIWAILALLAVIFVEGRNQFLVAMLLGASIIASLVGVALQYNLI